MDALHDELHASLESFGGINKATNKYAISSEKNPPVVSFLHVFSLTYLMQV